MRAWKARTSCHTSTTTPGIAKTVIGAVAPVVGQMSGPIGTAVGAAVGGGVQALGGYDRLKMEAMNQGNQVGQVGAAIKRGIG